MKIVKNEFTEFYEKNIDDLMDEFCNEVKGEEFAKFIIERFADRFPPPTSFMEH